ncbi:hypothetical protein ACE6H2_026940 [Prunus campanulata]
MALSASESRKMVGIQPVFLADISKEVDIARKVLNNLIAPSATETTHDDLALPQRDKETSMFESSEEPSKSSFETAQASDVTTPEKLSKRMAPNLE